MVLFGPGEKAEDAFDGLTNSLTNEVRWTDQHETCNLGSKKWEKSTWQLRRSKPNCKNEASWHIALCKKKQLINSVRYVKTVEWTTKTPHKHIFACNNSIHIVPWHCNSTTDRFENYKFASTTRIGATYSSSYVSASDPASQISLSEAFVWI